MAFSNPIDQITFPAGANTGTARMVVGADTPPELRLYGIDQAILAYIIDVATGVERGYFFIGSSNRMDGAGNSRAMVYGNVTYPTPGVPSSATMSDVQTNFQQDMFAQYPNTIFKDHVVTMWTDMRFETTNGFTSFSSDGVEMVRGYVESATHQVGVAVAAGPETAFTVANWGAHEPNMTFKNNRIYKVELQCLTGTSVAGDNAIAVRLRKGSATITGQQLWRWDFECNNLFAHAVKNGTAYVKNQSGADITTALSITGQRSGGGNTVAVSGDVNNPLIITVQDLGVRLDQYGVAINVAVDRLATAIV